jgi:truncated hemoglobin YjbI
MTKQFNLENKLTLNPDPNTTPLLAQAMGSQTVDFLLPHERIYTYDEILASVNNYTSYPSASQELKDFMKAFVGNIPTDQEAYIRKELEPIFFTTLQDFSAQYRNKTE